MTNCERLTSCPFFNDRLANRPATIALMKSQYCQGNQRACARYQWFITFGGDIPGDLFPNMLDRVQEALNQATQ